MWCGWKKTSGDEDGEGKNNDKGKDGKNVASYQGLITRESNRIERTVQIFGILSRENPKKLDLVRFSRN